METINQQPCYWMRDPRYPLFTPYTEDLVSSDGSLKRFIFSELSAERFEDVFAHLCPYFIRDHPMFSSINLSAETESMFDLMSAWAHTLTKRFSIAAFLQPHNEETAQRPIIAAASLLLVTNDDFFTFPRCQHNYAPKISEILDFNTSTMTMRNPLELFQASHHIVGAGMVVHPLYRGFGLGERLLKAREEIASIYNIPLSTSVFPSAQTQNMALRAGYWNVVVRPYDHAIDDNGRLLFPSLRGQTINMMCKRML